MKQFKLSDKSKERLLGVDSRLLSVIDLALVISPVDFGIPNLGGLRSADQQHRLFLDGLSNCDGLEVKSYHQSGLAFDVYAYVDGKATWDELYLTKVAAAMLQAAAKLSISLEWGGNWESWKDLPHFEIRV